MANLIRAYQIAPKAVNLSLLADEVIAKFTTLDGQVANILDTMSTDAERIAAIQAVTDAFGAADQNLQGAITALGSGISAGAGLGEGGAYVQKADANYIQTATSIHGATVLLDSALKSVADGLAAETAAREQAVNNLQGQITALGSAGNTAGASIAFETATVSTEDKAAGHITVAHDILTTAAVVVMLNGQTVASADVGFVDGQAKKLSITGLPAEAFDGSFQVLYFFR